MAFYLFYLYDSIICNKMNKNNGRAKESSEQKREKIRFSLIAFIATYKQV